MAIGRTNVSSYNPKKLPKFSYDGSYATSTDASGWTITFLTSGTLTIGKVKSADIHCVGGGGGGGRSSNHQAYSNIGGGGGGGGYTATYTGRSIAKGTYTITIGSGGNVCGFGEDGATGGTSSFGEDFTATGGNGGQGISSSNRGGNGGSGGGGGNYSNTGGNGGSNGSNGASAVGAYGAQGGTGQGTTTYDFADSILTLRAGGGAGTGSNRGTAGDGGGGGTVNYGGGGHGSYGLGNSPTNGGSGIVIIRNAR